MPRRHLNVRFVQVLLPLLVFVLIVVAGCGSSSSSSSGEATGSDNSGAPQVISLSTADWPALPTELNGAVINESVEGMAFDDGQCQFDEGTDGEPFFECGDGTTGFVGEGYEIEKPHCEQEEEGASTFACKANSGTAEGGGVDFVVTLAPSLKVGKEVLRGLYELLSEDASGGAAGLQPKYPITPENLTSCLEAGGAHGVGVREGVAGADGDLLIGNAGEVPYFAVIFAASESLISNIEDNGADLPEVEPFEPVPGNPHVLYGFDGPTIDPDPAAVEAAKVAGVKEGTAEEVLALIVSCTTEPA